MSSDKVEYVFSPVKEGVFSDWDNLLGFPVEKILPEYFFISREENLVGITTVQIAMIEFDKIMGSVNELLTLASIPDEVLNELFKEEKVIKSRSLIKRINPFYRDRVKESDFDPSRILKLIYAINRVRFELFSFVIVNLSNLQAREIKELTRLDKVKNYEGLHLAYKDLLNRSAKKDREAHFKANPHFIKHLPEDGVVMYATTKN